jgi:hypothetical protein
MLRVQRTAGALTVVSRLARPHALAVLALAFLGGAAAAAGRSSVLATGLALAGVLVAVLGGRAVRARFERGRVWVRDAVPLRGRERALSEFAAAAVETVGDARRRRAERLARGFAERSGTELPPWLRPPDAPGTHDHLRRVVLVARAGEDLAVTAWLGEEDVEGVRAEIEALLR